MLRKVALGIMLTLLFVGMLSLASTTVYAQVHDVAVIDVCQGPVSRGLIIPDPSRLASINKTVVGQNCVAFINVTVKNVGDFPETFNVSAFYNETPIVIPEQWPNSTQFQNFWSMGDVNRDGYVDYWDALMIVANVGWIGPPGQNPADLSSDGKIDIKDANICARNFGRNIWTTQGIPNQPMTHTVVTLPVGNSTNIMFRGNATSLTKGYYIISANATLPDDANPADNNFVDGGITIAMKGDIRGPDGKVDIKDVAFVAKLFGTDCVNSTGVSLQYNPDCDITGHWLGVPDGKIDIADIAIVAGHFGQTDP